MPIRLDKMCPKKEELTRRFRYPESASNDLAFYVHLDFLSPAKKDEIISRARTRFLANRKRMEEISAEDREREILTDMTVECIRCCEGVTFRKLAALVPISADAVRDNGGLDVAVPMNPLDKDPKLAEDGLANVRYLVANCEPFTNWVQRVAGNIANFQAADWEERVKNSESGPVSSTTSE